MKKSRSNGRIDYSILINFDCYYCHCNVHLTFPVKAIIHDWRFLIGFFFFFFCACDQNMNSLKDAYRICISNVSLIRRISNLSCIKFQLKKMEIKTLIASREEVETRFLLIPLPPCCVTLNFDRLDDKWFFMLIDDIFCYNRKSVKRSRYVVTCTHKWFSNEWQRRCQIRNWQANRNKVYLLLH